MLTGIVRFRRVEEVTTVKDEPTPIYVLDELGKAAKVSPEDSQHIVEHLMKKLESKNPIVKAKALRACKYLSQHGAYDAQRILQRNSAPIRNLKTFKGPPDAMKGDALNERVRVTAAETIEAIFSNETVSQSIPKSSAASSRIQGFGNQSNSAVSSTSYVDQIKMAEIPTYQYQSGSFLAEVPKTEMEKQDFPIHEPTKASNVVGDEEDLVDNICQPSGVRLAPAKEDLRRFIDTVGTMNGPKVAMRLQEKLQSRVWQQTYRALCVIEAVILQGSSISCGEIGVHFQGDLDLIRKCSESVQNSVRDRANRILSIFKEEDDDEGEDEKPSAETVGSTPSLLSEDVNTSAAPIIDLLGEIPSQEVKTSASVSPMAALDDLEAPTVEAKVVNPTMDMFSGITISDSKASGKESNEHLAALLAPSPPSDPFPETTVSIEAPELNSVVSHAPVPNTGFYPAAAVMPPPQMPMGYAMPYMPTMMMNPNPHMFQQMPQPQTQAMYNQGAPGVDNRGEVPLSAFVGPAHTEKRNSGGKANAAFGFIGDHMSELRGKK